MQVFLIRHAEAIDETLEVRDPHRHLTERGRTQARSLGDRLRWHDCEPTHVWSSPLVRAMQTAELVAVGLQSTVVIESVPSLGPDASPRQVVSSLATLPDDAIVVLVGHEPALSAIATLLAGQDVGTLAKAEAVRIDNGRVRWRFAWDAEAPASR